MNMKKPRIALGLDTLLDDPPVALKKGAFGLLAHQASVDSRLAHTKDVLFDALPGSMKKLFSPQHGFRGEKQDNMIVSDSYRDATTGLPVISLYGETLRPRPELFEGLDALVIDLQDVGTRVYTYIHTVALCLETCRDAGVAVYVLDRPNPIGGTLVEGNVLKPDMASFVGLYPIPMRHGMTIGEMALFCATQCGIGADLTVVPLRGWERSMNFPDTGLAFVPPSPNMPLYETALVYPGQVIWEGTNVSEGRGTTRPFEWFGAPFIDQAALRKTFLKRGLPGLFLRDIGYEPGFGKWTGRTCRGFHLHVTDAERFEPYFTSLCLLQDILSLWPGEFAWKEPPYEYEYKRAPIDLILGDSDLRKVIETGEDLMEMKKGWQAGLDGFLEKRSSCLLY